MKFFVGTVCCFLIFIWAEEVEAIFAGGSDAEDAQFPYQVYLTNAQEKFCCGGSILNEITILTAGHCIYNRTTGRQEDSVDVIAGTNNRELSRNNDYVKVRVTKIVCHPDYIDFGSNDIAILKLKTPLQFSDRIKPVKLPASKIPDNGRLIASGWGATFWSEKIRHCPFHLQYIYLQPTNLEECRAKMNISNICTNPDSHSTGCFGDSGGPAVGNNDHRQYGVLASIVEKCVPGTHNILTSVYYNLNWLEENKFSTAYSYRF